MMHIDVEDSGDIGDEGKGQQAVKKEVSSLKVPDCDDCIESYQFPRLFSVPLLSTIEDPVFTYKIPIEGLLSVLRFGIATPAVGESVQASLRLLEGDATLRSICNAASCMTIDKHGSVLRQDVITTHEQTADVVVSEGEIHIVPDERVLTDSSRATQKKIDGVLLPTSIRCVLIKNPEEVVQGIYLRARQSVEAYMRERFWNKEAGFMLCAPLWLLAGFHNEPVDSIIAFVEEQAEGLVTCNQLQEYTQTAISRIMKTFPCDTSDAGALVEFLQQQSGIPLLVQEP